MDDQKIIELYFARDEEAISESDKKYHAYCFTVSRNILGSPESAEECVNDTWLSAWNSIPPHRPKSLKLFFAKLSRNAALDRRRRQRAQKRGGGELPLILDELDEVIPGRFDLEEEFYLKEAVRILKTFVKELRDDDRTLFLQRYFYAVPLEDIAENSELSPNAVAVRLYRLRKELRQCLESEGYYA